MIKVKIGFQQHLHKKNCILNPECNKNLKNLYRSLNREINSEDEYLEEGEELFNLHINQDQVSDNSEDKVQDDDFYIRK